MERCGSVEGGDSAVEIANSSDTTWSDYTTMYRRNGLSRSCQCGEKSSRSKETKRTKLVKLVANGRSKISVHQAALPLPAAASPVLRSSNKGSPHQVSEGKTRLSRADSASLVSVPKSCTNNNHHKALVSATATPEFEAHRNNGKLPCHLRSQTLDVSTSCQSHGKHRQQQLTGAQAASGHTEGSGGRGVSTAPLRRRHSASVHNQRDQTMSISALGPGEPHQKLLIIEDEQKNGLPLNHQCDPTNSHYGNNHKQLANSKNGVVRVVMGSSSKVGLNGFDATFYKQITSLARLGQNGCVPVPSVPEDVSDVTEADSDHVAATVPAKGSQSTSSSCGVCDCETDSASKWNCDKGSSPSVAVHLNGTATDKHWGVHPQPFSPSLTGIFSKQAASHSRTSRQQQQQQHGSHPPAATAGPITSLVSSSHRSLSSATLTSSSSSTSLISSTSQAKNSCKRRLSHSKSSPCIASSSAADSETKAAVDKTVKCQWKKCNATPDAPDLMDHIQREHVNSQSGESFVCLWDGCRVYNKKSCSRKWLERHCVSHSGNKPFFCIFDGCGQRFLSHKGLERHVNSHFNACQTAQNKQIRSSGETPSKSQKKKNKTRKKTQWKVKKTDFIDKRTMDAIQRSLFTSRGPLSVHASHATSTATSSSSNNGAATGNRVTFHSTVIASRQEKSGAKEVLLRWTPSNILPDEWVPESQAILPQQQTRAELVSMLPRDTLDQLHPSAFTPQHRRRKHHRK